MSLAGVAHPVERHLAKVEVASSSLVTRSIEKKKQMRKHLLFLFYACKWDDGSMISKISMKQSEGLFLAAQKPRRHLDFLSQYC